jgi:hypothetical protein
MFTIFHVLIVIGLVAGAIAGAGAGSALFGSVGGVVGGIVGAITGRVLGHIPFLLGVRLIARRLRSNSVAELRELLHNPDCMTPNFLLLELSRRGEDIYRELPIVLDLLASPAGSRRGFGWAALTSAFPELVEQIRDYRLGDSVEECRRKTDRLRQAACS